MDDLPIWLRTWTCGILLGAASGVIAAMGLLGVLAVTGATENGVYSDASVGFVVGVALMLVMSAVVGALVGMVLGFLSGGLAAALLSALLRITSPKIAARLTGVIVLVAQTAIGLAIVEHRVWWAALIVPAVSVIPLTIAIRSGTGVNRLSRNA